MLDNCFTVQGLSCIENYAEQRKYISNYSFRKMGNLGYLLRAGMMFGNLQFLYLER